MAPHSSSFRAAKSWVEREGFILCALLLERVLTVKASCNLQTNSSGKPFASQASIRRRDAQAVGADPFKTLEERTGFLQMWNGAA